VKPPLNIDEFKPLAKLVAGYELDPSKVYVVICDGKNFNFDLANAIMKDVRESHPNLNVCIVATLHPKSIEIAEKKNDDRPDEPAV